MPFTPIHMGPGLLCKALLQSGFSLPVFGWTQIVMDVQPLFVLIAGEGHLHGFTHTYAGALIIALLSAVSGKYLSEFALRGLGRDRFLPIRWRIACLSALIGCLSHVLLDSIMHADVEPFAPFVAANPILGTLSLESLHKLCLYTGLLGIGLYFLTKTRIKRRSAH